MAGTPCTVVSTRQTPSPGSGLPANVFSGGGAVKEGTGLPGLTEGLTKGTDGPVSAKDGLPPAFGGL